MSLLLSFFCFTPVQIMKINSTTERCKFPPERWDFNKIYFFLNLQVINEEASWSISIFKPLNENEDFEVGGKSTSIFFFFFQKYLLCCSSCQFSNIKKKKTRGIWELLFFLSSKRCEYSAVKNKEWGKNPKRINANN